MVVSGFESKKLVAYTARRKPPLDTAMVSEQNYNNIQILKEG